MIVHIETQKKIGANSNNDREREREGIIIRIFNESLYIDRLLFLIQFKIKLNKPRHA